MIVAPGVDKSVLAELRVNRFPLAVRRSDRPTTCVREWTHPYEDEGSERRSLGSVAVGGGAWWSIALTVPASTASAREDVVLVRLERHGEMPAGVPSSAADALLLPASEIEAVLLLLAGVVDQARRDGVLPSASS
jgi:hypothetical protein